MITGTSATADQTESVLAVGLVRRLGEAQPLQNGLGAALFQQLDKLPRGEGLEAGDALVEAGRLGDEVQVVLQHDPAIESLFPSAHRPPS